MTRATSAVAGTLGALLLAAAPLHAGEIYKTVDAQGHVVYSDHADSTAQKTEVQVDQPIASEVARNAKEQAVLKAQDDLRRKQQAVDALKKAKADHDKQVACDAAKSRFYAMKDARRLFDRDADGNRLYLSDADATVKRDEAHQAMLSACEQ